MGYGLDAFIKRYLTQGVMKFYETTARKFYTVSLS